MSTPQSEQQDTRTMDEEGIPEKFHGKSRKEISEAYQEVERLAHEKAADAARLQALTDLNQFQNSGTFLPASGTPTPLEQPAASGSGEDFEAMFKRDPRGTLEVLQTTTYKRAVEDTMRIIDARDAVTHYLNEHPHLKKLGKLFQAEVQAAWKSKGSNQSLYDVLESARKQTEESVRDLSASSTTGGTRRLLDGQDSGESRAAARDRAKANDDDDDNSLEAYLAERNRRRPA